MYHLQFIQTMASTAVQAYIYRRVSCLSSSDTRVSANEEIRAVEIYYWWHVILSKTVDELFYITVFGKFYISAKLPVQHVRQFVQTPVYVCALYVRAEFSFTLFFHAAFCF